MSNETVIKFFQNRPFIPFAMITVDGRQFTIHHPEQAMFGIRGETVLFIHPDLRLEVIDSRLILSLVTLSAADFYTFGE